MTPVYIVGKISALIGAIVVLWQEKWDLSSATSKAALAVGIGALGSLFEDNKWVNLAFGFITKFLGVPYTPDPKPADTKTNPPV